MALHVGTVGPVIRADNMEPEVLRQLCSVLSGERDGIVRGTDFAVTQNGGGAMNVLVSSGLALLTGTDSARAQGQYHFYNDAPVTVTVPTANGSNPRVDLICLTNADAYYSGASNTPTLVDVAGTPAASPAVPATPADSLVIAHIYVATAVGSILSGAINGTAGVNNPDVYAFTPMRAAGLLASKAGTGGSVTATAAPGTLVPGLSAVVNVGAGRNIRIRYSDTFVNSGATPTAVWQIYKDGVANIQGISLQFIGAANYMTVMGEAVDAPTAGVHQYAVNAYSLAANTQTYTAGRGTLIIEDAGPV